MAVKGKYRNSVKIATLAAGAIGIPGAFSFGLDLTAVSGIWVTMMLKIAEKSGHKIDHIFATKLAASILAGVGSYVGGSKLAMKLLHLLPVAGSLAAMGVNGTLNALYTYKLGHAVSNLLDKGQLDTSDYTAAAFTILSLITSLPTPDETVDIVVLVTVG